MTLFFSPRFQALDGNGDSISGGKLYFYETGTSTPKDTYSDSALTTPNANPVVADASGRFAGIFLSGSYKVVLKDSSDVTIWTEDPVSGAASGSLGSLTEDTTPQLGGQLDVNGKAIGDGTNEFITFVEDASAVNHIEVENEATGSGPIIRAAGDDTNVDLNIAAKGSGLIKLNNMVKLSQGSDIASATALTLGTDGNSFDITGTTTITSIGTLGVGTHITLQFDGALALTHHATDLILPGAANITTAAGDVAVFYEYTAGGWRCVSYQVAASAPGGGGGKVIKETYGTATGAITMSGDIPYDTSTPQNTEGTEAITLSVTQDVASSTVEISVHGWLSAAGATRITVALFVDSDANAIQVRPVMAKAAWDSVPIDMMFKVSAGDTSAHTYKIRIGSSSGSVFWMSDGGTLVYGSVDTAYLIAKEIAA